MTSIETINQFLDSIREIDKKATKGPWRHGYDDGSGKWNESKGAAIVGLGDNTVCHSIDAAGCPGGILRSEDANFIAEARTTLPLCAQSLRVAVDALDEVLSLSGVETLNFDISYEVSLAEKTLDQIARILKEEKHE